jgi:hypothetical protein
MEGQPEGMLATMLMKSEFQLDAVGGDDMADKQETGLVER